MEASVVERFWLKVAQAEGCWLWLGAKGRRGYGYLHRGGKTDRHPIRAHRASWEIHFGAIPAGLWVLHKCDNPPCVNPNHLFLGTRKDNMDDCASKGRVCTIGQSLKVECKRGHAFTIENTIRDARGHRKCRCCKRLNDCARRADKRRIAAAIREGGKA